MAKCAGKDLRVGAVVSFERDAAKQLIPLICGGAVALFQSVQVCGEGVEVRRKKA
jgi:hypothetical protein